MDIFMKGVPLAASEDDVKIELAKILHKAPFPVEPTVLNFDLHFFKKSDSRGKTGNLTLPTPDAGRLFLTAYGRTGVPVKGGIVIFSISRRPVDVEKVAILNSTEWQDPQRLKLEKDRRLLEGRPFPLKSYAFGRFLNDGTFSSEFVADGKADIACDLERHRVRFTLHKQSQPPASAGVGPHDIYGLSSGVDMITTYMQKLASRSVSIVTYPRDAVDTIVEASTNTDPVLFIRANTFPCFAVESFTMFQDRADVRRSQGLIPDVPMPPGCFSLMCTFAEASDKDAFIHAARSRFHLRYTRKQGTIRIRQNPTARLASRHNLEFLSKLPFELAFEVEKAVTNWVISALDAFTLMERLEGLCDEHGDAAAPMFRRFITLLEEGGNKRMRRRRRSRRERDGPTTLEGQLLHAVEIYLAELSRPKGRFALLGAPSSIVSYTYHLILTPTRYILDGPVADQSNSVLRRFGNHECFLRVSFQDENRSKLRRDLEMSIKDVLDKRYRPILLEGCTVAGRRYQLLGYSMSGLKEHSLWFVTPFRNDEGRLMDAKAIRNSLGDFSRLSHQPARLGARWSQAFSATEASITLRPDEIRRIKDIVSPANKVMTDGCSPISTELAADIWRANQAMKKYPQRVKVPSAFQYRLSGAKGMVVQDPRLVGRVVCLRPSQVKFEAPENRTFDIQTTSLRPKTTFLNRPLIALLEYLKSSSDRILELQDLSIKEAQSVQKSFVDASKVLEHHGLGMSFQLPSLLRSMSTILKLKMYDENEPESTVYNDVIANALHCAETHILRELKYRAHIAIPGSFTLLGVSDEWDCLAEGEIYATVYDEKRKLHQEITGTVAITRSPQIHPGDIQVVTAVRRPELSHLTNVVVFSCRGDRSLSSCLGGGDMDGDDFNLIIDPDLIPQLKATPGEYISLPIKTTERPCGISDVVNFIFDYIEADLVGHIAISHLRFSDRADPSCGECLRLAELASQAVDFPKTGTPVQFSDLPKNRHKERPDFLAREGAALHSDKYYPSVKLLGQLYRRVPVKDFMPQDWNDTHPPSGGDIIEQALHDFGLYGLGLSIAEPSAMLQEEMDYLLDDYTERLIVIAATHTLSKNKDIYVSESELVSGTIMANWSDHNKRREEVGAMNFETHELVRAVRVEMRGNDTAENEEQLDEDDLSDDGDWYYEEEADYYRESRHIAESFKRAWAAWCAAEKALREEPGRYGPQSFGLIALGRMLQLIKAAQQLV